MNDWTFAIWFSVALSVGMILFALAFRWLGKRNSPDSLIQIPAHMSGPLICLGLVLPVLTAYFWPVTAVVTVLSDHFIHRHYNDVDLSGVVVDDASGVPVANARVIVEFQWQIWMACQSYGIATTTDANGRFHIRTQTPFTCNRQFVYASAPNNDYGFTSEERDEITVRLGPLQGPNATLPRYRYERFSPGYFRSSAEIEFVGKPWTLADWSEDSHLQR